jgi:hypothetical protein
MKTSKAIYEQTAAILRARLPDEPDMSNVGDYWAVENVRLLALAFADAYTVDNPRFDRFRFFAACGLAGK